ncbi:MAG: hypothetical protein IPL33_11500 [Sphingobacteriales bacterium]|nr:hypothetical protein [Sphingobacteriales bacterium]MCC7222412.1 hypothetical protein [Chitinophagales bacterium]
MIFCPFVGSGTTLLVAENLERRAVGLELDDKYCDYMLDTALCQQIWTHAHIRKTAVVE